MIRLFARAVLGVTLFFVAAEGAWAQPAPAGDLFTVSGVHVDATAESATAARDHALSDGRPIAWQRLYRRLTPQTSWDKQPQLDDNALQRVIRSFEVVNERRSTTRYLADVTYHFNAGDVRRMLRDASAPLAETRARPVLVLPVTTGKGYDANSAWTKAWSDPALSEGVVPFVLPTADGQDMAILSRGDIGALDWTALRNMAGRYDATEVVVAQLGGDGAISVRYVTPTGVETQSIGVAPGAYGPVTDAVSRKLGDAWKLRSAVDYGKTSSLVADAGLASLQDWTAMRTKLSQVKMVTDVAVQGMSLHEVQMQITYYGRPEQLADGFSQQDLDLHMDGGVYTLRVAPTSASSAKTP